MSAEYVEPSGIRVCALVFSTHVEPGATLPTSGARGPEPRRTRTVTASVVDPGLKTSISPEPPATSWLWGTVQCDSAFGAPVTSESPPEDPANACTSVATTRPVRVETTVLMMDSFCTSAATSSTCTWPDCKTMPW